MSDNRYGLSRGGIRSPLRLHSAQPTHPCTQRRWPPSKQRAQKNKKKINKKKRKFQFAVFTDDTPQISAWTFLLVDFHGASHYPASTATHETMETMVVTATAQRKSHSGSLLRNTFQQACTLWFQAFIESSERRCRTTKCRIIGAFFFTVTPQNG